MWPDLIDKAKDGGVDVIQTYVFWNGHEPSPGNYYFEDRYDLVRFIKVVQKAGLYVNLRIGPYACAEWNFGGFPVWLKYVPGISFRTDNRAFMGAMEKFTEKIVSMMKSERLFESQGGPIILSQIENEYGPLETNAGDRGYANWAAKMAVGLKTGVPWLMCKQDDAPDPVINTCNGFYCDYFSPNKPYKPKMWTENWTGWFTAFGGATPTRPAEDLAFSTARFIQKGGSYVNYYMYHGGTNFEHTAGGPFIATSYDYDAPIDEYGLLNEPKWSHLKNLHLAIKMSEAALVEADPVVASLGRNQQSNVFKSKTSCAAFLANFNSRYSATVLFNGNHYNLPPWSISILPDCKNVVYNTATVTAEIKHAKMQSVKGFNWVAYKEEAGPYESRRSFTWNGLREQNGVTWDKTDYLWYTTYIEIGHGEEFLKTGSSRHPILTVESAGPTLQVFINGEQAGTAYGSKDHSKLTFTGPVKLRAGSNKISLLSGSLGLPNIGMHYEKWNVGILGPVFLNGLNEGKRSLDSQKWFYTIGLKGESLHVYSGSGSNSVRWEVAFPNQPITWYKTYFNAPGGNEPFGLDMGSMGKGEMWINGRSIGRHWPGYKAYGTCVRCNYGGTYNENKCNTNCGKPSQRWYHIPRSWLKATGNLLVVFEQWGGDPRGISLAKRTVG